MNLLSSIQHTDILGHVAYIRPAPCIAEWERVSDYISVFSVLLRPSFIALQLGKYLADRQTSTEKSSSVWTYISLFHAAYGR